MKKLLITVILASLGFLNVNAQDKGGFEFGLGSGINFSEVSLINVNTDNNLSIILVIYSDLI